MICVAAGSKSNLGKAAGAEVAVERRHEKLHAAVARSTFYLQLRQRGKTQIQFRGIKCACATKRLAIPRKKS